MTTAIHTPLDFSEPVKAGRRRFWKQLLPVTSIDYNGSKINFDQPFHMDLATAFKDKAYDQVPLVFADSENRHNMDPRNFGGEVVDVEYRGKDKGTWALIEADRSAARIINKNPKLGVSARIMQDVRKSDGRSYPRAINHVLMTMNPRVSGMEPWQAVDLSDEDADIEVVDLTAETYEEGTPIMGRSGTQRRVTKTGARKQTIDLSALSDEQFQQMLDLAGDAVLDEEVDEDDLDDEPDDLEVENPRPTRRKKSKTKITVEKDSEDDGDDDEDEDDDDPTDLSERVVDRQTISDVRQMRIDLAEDRWRSERSALIREGVPVFMLDLAAPVLSQPGSMTIDLSDDESVDVNDVLRQMLDGAKGLMDLSDERGHAIDLADEDDDADAFNKAWDEQYGR